MTVLPRPAFRGRWPQEAVGKAGTMGLDHVQEESTLAVNPKGPSRAAELRSLRSPWTRETRPEWKERDLRGPGKLKAVSVAPASERALIY